MPNEDLQSLIVVDPAIMHGQACIAGTRIPVSVILDCVAAGLSDDEIIAQYPGLTTNSIRASAAYGSLLAREEIVPLSTQPA